MSGSRPESASASRQRARSRLEAVLTGRTLALTWGLSRLCVVALLAREELAVADLNYFFYELERWSSQGSTRTLPEYPLPAVGLLALPWLVAGQVGGHLVYIGLAMGVLMAADALFMLRLFRSVPWGRRAALSFWVLAPPALGAISYARLDVVPGLLAAWAVLLVWSRPRTAGLLVALGAGIKLWPALLLPALAAVPHGRRVLMTGLGAGVALATISLLLVGWQRTVSPVAWQSARGLQIEAVAATPLMARWGWFGSDHEISFSDFNAYELTGRGVGAALAATDVMLVGLIVLLLALWVRAWRSDTADPRATVVWTSLAAVTGLVVTSKVFSPQYLLWLLPLAAVAVVVVEGDEERRALARWAALLLAVTLATHVIFPLNYAPVVIQQDATAEMVTVLVLRNVLLVGMFGTAAWRAWRATSAGSTIGYARADSNSQ